MEAKFCRSNGGNEHLRGQDGFIRPETLEMMRKVHCLEVQFKEMEMNGENEISQELEDWVCTLNFGKKRGIPLFEVRGYEWWWSGDASDKRILIVKDWGDRRVNKPAGRFVEELSWQDWQKMASSFNVDEIAQQIHELRESWGLGVGDE